MVIKKLVAFGLFVLLTGCGRPVPTMEPAPANPAIATEPSKGNYVRPFNRTIRVGDQEVSNFSNVTAGTIDDTTVFAVWVAVASGEGQSLSISGDPLGDKGSISSGNGKAIPFGCRTHDGKTGVATIGTEQFDLANGGLFLVAVSESRPPRARQLNRPLPTRQNSEKFFEGLLEDVEINDFFQGTGFRTQKPWGK